MSHMSPMDLLAHMTHQMERAQTTLHWLYMQVERSGDWEAGFKAMQRITETSYAVSKASLSPEMLTDPEALVAMYDGFVVFAGAEADAFAAAHP